MFKSNILLARLTELRDWATVLYNHFVGGAPHTQWMVPEDADVVSPINMGASFADDNLQEKLVEGHEEQAEYLTVMQINMQINALAAMERSFRSRHMSPVRALYMSAGRHLGQSELINESIT